MTTITGAVIHKLIKEPHGEATVHQRDTELRLNEPVRKLVNDISALYGEKANKGYGQFEEDTLTFPSSTVLREMFETKAISFVEGSQKLLAVLAGKANQAALSKGGYVLMAHGLNDAKIDWFLVAIINNVSGSAVNEETLEIEEAVHVDLENLRVAGRVNLSTWLAGDQQTRYVGFLKHRGDVADYFKYFLGCKVVVKNAEETKRLVDGLLSFARSESLSALAEDSFLRTAHGYCKNRGKDNPISLEELSNAAWPQEPSKLQRSLAAAGVEINDGFVPDGRSLKSLLKFHGKTAFWSVDLDRRAFNNGSAVYLKDKGAIVLNNLPPALKAELDEEVRGDE